MAGLLVLVGGWGGGESNYLAYFYFSIASYVEARTE